MAAAGAAGAGAGAAIEPVTATSSAGLPEAGSRSACAAFTVAGAIANSARGDDVQNHTAAIRAAETIVATIRPNALRMEILFLHTQSYGRDRAVGDVGQ